MAEAPEQIHPDALRAAGDVVEALHELGFTCSLAYIEGSEYPDGQHYLVNIDAVGDWIEEPHALQRKLDSIDESASEHADELMVTSPEAPRITHDPDVGDPVFWELEAVIRIIEESEKPAG
jgi:hypothetical protein